MPVMVTGAESALGADVLARLRRTGGELRAFLDGTVTTDAVAARLRAAGCKVAVGELDDEGHLESALEQVHTVAHCWSGPLREPDALVEVAATLGSAALGAGVRRIVWVSELTTRSDNPYLAAVTEMRGLFEALPLETVMVATALRYGDGDDFTALLRAGWLSGTAVDGEAPHAPIHLHDVAQAVAAADQQRGSRGELHMALALVGPERRTLGEFVAHLGAPPLDAARPADIAPPPAWLIDWLSRPVWEHAVADGVVTVARGANRLPGA